MSELEEAVKLIGTLLPCKFRRPYGRSCIEHRVIQLQWCKVCKFYLQPKFGWLKEKLREQGRLADAR